MRFTTFERKRIFTRTVASFGYCHNSANAARRCRRTDLACGFTANNTAYTLAMWIRSLGTQGGGNRIFEEQTSGFQFQLFANQSAINIFLRNDAAQTVLNAFSPSGVYLYDNKWHHIAFADNNGAYAFYYDGILTNSASYTKSGVYTPTTRAAIGIEAEPTHNYNNFNGYIDEVLAFSNALTQKQILALLYKKDVTGLTKTLDIEFDEGSGTTVADASGNAKNFSLASASGAWVSVDTTNMAQSFDLSSRVVAGTRLSLDSPRIVI